MVAWTKRAAEIWRDFVVGSSGAKQFPVKPDIRAWGLQVENAVDAAETTLARVLATSRTYFVAATGGSDSNDGLTSGTAFATLQKAWDTVCTLNLNNNNVTIQVTGTGTRTFAPAGTQVINLANFPSGAGLVIFLGNPANSAEVKLVNTVANGACVRANASFGGVQVRLNGFELTATGSNASGIVHRGNGRILLQNIRFNGTSPMPFGIQISADNAHIEHESEASNELVFTGQFINGILCDSGYFISVSFIRYLSSPEFTGAQFESNFGGRMFLTAFTGAPSAGSLVRAIVKDRALLRVHTGATIPGTGAINIQPGSVYDDGGFAVLHSCFPVAYGLVTLGAGVPGFAANYGFNTLIVGGGAGGGGVVGKFRMKLDKRMFSTAGFPVIATPVESDGSTARVQFIGGEDDEFEIWTFNSANALANIGFSVAVFGNQRPDIA